MKKILIFMTLLIFLFALNSCATPKNERFVIHEGTIQASYSYDLNDPHVIIPLADYILYGILTEVNDGVYPFGTIFGSLPVFPHTLNIKNVIYGDMKSGNDINYYWPSGYVSFPLWVAATTGGDQPAKSFDDDPEEISGIDLNKYIDDPNAFYKIYFHGHPIIEEGENLIVLIQKSEYYDHISIGYILFKNDKTYGSTLFEDGISFDDVAKIIMDIKANT